MDLYGTKLYGIVQNYLLCCWLHFAWKRFLVDNQWHLRFCGRFQDAWSTTTYLKTPNCFQKLFCWRWFGNEWAYDEFTLKWKKRFNTLWECLLINFLLKTTLSTTFSPFLFLTVDFIHGHGQGNLPSCPGLVKIVVNFLHRVCTMLQLICTFTLS